MIDILKLDVLYIIVDEVLELVFVFFFFIICFFVLVVGLNVGIKDILFVGCIILIFLESLFVDL